MSSSSSSSYIENWSSSSSSYIEEWSSSSTSSLSSSSSSYIENWSSSSSSYIENWSSSSSSSSDEFNTLPVSLPIINQNNGDIIPFTWFSEGGVAGDGSVVGFTIESSNSPYFDYTAIIDRDNSAVTTTPSTTSTVYVPNSDDVKYKHEKSFYVDVIAKDPGGIKEINTHVEPNGYDFVSVENAGQRFFIPRFTWK